MFLFSLPGSPVKKFVINDVGPFVAKKGLERIAVYVGKNMVWDDGKKLEEYFGQILAPFGLKGEAFNHIFNHYTVCEEGKRRFHYDPKIAEPIAAVKEWVDIDLFPMWEKIDKQLPIMIIHGETSDLLSYESIEKNEGRPR